MSLSCRMRLTRRRQRQAHTPTIYSKAGGVLRGPASSNFWKAFATLDWLGMVNIRIQRPRRRRVFTALKDCEPPPTCMTDSFVLDHLGGVVREHREHLRKLSQGSIGHQNQIGRAHV